MKFYIIIIPYKSKRPFKSGKQSNSRICSIVSHYTIVIIIIHYKSTHNQVRLFLPGGSYKASCLHSWHLFLQKSDIIMKQKVENQVLVQTIYVIPTSMIFMCGTLKLALQFLLRKA